MRPGVIPLDGAYNGWLVAVSLVIAVCAAYVALDLAGRVTEARGRGRRLWLVGGAGAMGLGIWSMHYVGMLAFRLPVPVLYDLPTVALSLFAAFVASGAALFVVSRRTLHAAGALGGSLVMGIAITAMHYIGMAAMRMPATCRWNAPLVALSVVIAIGVSFVALWLAFRFRAQGKLALPKIAGAAAMGFAVAAMHYTGMAAASFAPAAALGDVSHAVDIDPLGVIGVVTITFMVLAVALVTAVVDRRFSAQSLALRRSEERYRLLFERSLAGLYRSTPDGRLLECNLAFARIFGYASCEECLARPTTDLYPDPESRAAFIRELLAEGASPDRESILRRRDGSTVWVLENATLLAGKDGRPEVIEGTLLDISERKQAERVLRESEARKAAILDASQQAIATFDREGRIVELNAVAERLHGCRREDVIGRPLVGLLMPESMQGELERSLTELLGDHGRSFLQPVEAVGRRSDGGEFPSELSIARVQIEGPPLFTSSVRDLSELRAVERVKQELISTVNHELRTPLTSIRGSLSLLASGALGELPPEAAEIVALAERNCLRLLALINDILDLERLDRGQLEMEHEPVPVEALMERSREVVACLAEARGIAIEVEPIPAAVLGDLDRLAQVLINLLSNAIKFSPRGSVVTVSAAACRETVEVRVRDRGRGISAGHHETIFERFKQVEASDARQKGGSGLGLAISKSIVQQLGGEVGVESEEGLGSTFWFRLPAARVDVARRRPLLPAAADLAASARR